MKGEVKIFILLCDNSLDLKLSPQSCFSSLFHEYGNEVLTHIETTKNNKYSFVSFFINLFLNSTTIN